MLEKLPHAVGEALRRVRPGPERCLCHAPELAAASASIAVTSSAFADEGAMPARHTADGEGVSPPLAWSGLPAGTRALALIVEDADSPTPAPLVHAIAWWARVAEGSAEGAAEGALAAGSAGRGGPGDGGADNGGPDHGGRDNGGPGIGRNSFLAQGWLPPDPPPGHGPHRYLFQLFALSSEPGLEGHPGRGALAEALRGRVLARGLLTGTYERR